mmetsp:Transcript_19594/g.51973  ORF Transcript_19594/g.51973 Transcript_19594/m.51973 type:complete len:308 (-) Transcript_19594:347-1270(-)
MCQRHRRFTASQGSVTCGGPQRCGWPRGLGPSARVATTVHLRTHSRPPSERAQENGQRTGLPATARSLQGRRRMARCLARLERRILRPALFRVHRSCRAHQLLHGSIARASRRGEAGAAGAWRRHSRRDGRRRARRRVLGVPQDFALPLTQLQGRLEATNLLPLLGELLRHTELPQRGKALPFPLLTLYKITQHHVLADCVSQDCVFYQLQGVQLSLCHWRHLVAPLEPGAYALPLVGDPVCRRDRVPHDLLADGAQQAFGNRRQRHGPSRVLRGCGEAYSVAAHAPGRGSGGGAWARVRRRSAATW